MSAMLYVTVAEAARLTGASRSLLYAALRSGRLPHVVVGQRTIRIPLDALGAPAFLAFLADQPARAQARRALRAAAWSLDALGSTAERPLVHPETAPKPARKAEAISPLAELEWIGVSEAARRAGVSSKTVANWVDRGLVASARVATLNNARLVDAASLHRYLEARQRG